jgi:uncharacterized damage-inducible protein DinB
LLGLAENNAWANHRFYRACAQLTDADRRAPRTSFFPSIHATLEHIVLVDEFYVDALLRGGYGYSIFDEEGKLTFEQMATRQRAVDRKLVDFVAAMNDPDAIAEIQRRDHVQREKVGDVLLHLLEHQIHHRGQAHAMMAGTSIKPPQLDEFFMSEELHLREEELRELGLRVR